MKQEIDDAKVPVFADEMLWTNEKMELEEHLNGWHNISKQYSLNINKNKT